jgi:hypothetical protein
VLCPSGAGTRPTGSQFGYELPHSERNGAQLGEHRGAEKHGYTGYFFSS